MFENYAGKLIFNDAPGRFSFQKDKVQTLTEENDIKLDTLGDDHKYLTVEVTNAGELEKDTFQNSDKPKEFACMKTEYQKLNPAHLFTYINSLIARFEGNKYRNNPQSYCIADETGFHELTKDEFYKS